MCVCVCVAVIWKFDEVSTNPKKYVISSHVLYGTAVKVELPSGGEDLDTYDVKNQVDRSSFPCMLCITPLVIMNTLPRSLLALLELYNIYSPIISGL